MEWTHGAGVAQALVGSFLPTKVGEGIETVCVVKALLVLTMATFHLSVVPGRIGADELCAVCPAVWPLPQRGARSRWLWEKRLVNAKPLSVWTHSTAMPLRAKCLTTLFRKSAEEKALCSS